MDETTRARLSRRHALVLRLKELGADDGLIADCLGIDVAGVGPLVTVAEAKLAEVMDIEDERG